jgi:hypothetical protein
LVALTGKSTVIPASVDGTNKAAAEIYTLDTALSLVSRSRNKSKDIGSYTMFMEISYGICVTFVNQ